MGKPKHPNQPLVLTDRILRFKENAIVSHLLRNGTDTMNTIASLPFSQEDREQFAQLIGYSFGGFQELSYVRRKTLNRVCLQNKDLIEKVNNRG